MQNLLLYDSTLSSLSASSSNSITHNPTDIPSSTNSWTLQKNMPTTATLQIALSTIATMLEDAGGGLSNGTLSPLSHQQNFLDIANSDFNLTNNNTFNSFHTNASTIAPSSNYVPYNLRPETYIVPVLFAFIFIVGVVGNGTLILVFMGVRQMRNVPNT